MGSAGTACWSQGSPTRFTPGWITIRPKGWLAWRGTDMAAIVGAGFDQEARTSREQAVAERLRQPPGAEAREELGLAGTSPPPSRWSVRTARASVAPPAASSLRGGWRLLQRLHLRRRPLRDHL